MEAPLPVADGARCCSTLPPLCCRRRPTASSGRMTLAPVRTISTMLRGARTMAWIEA